MTCITQQVCRFIHHIPKYTSKVQFNTTIQNKPVNEAMLQIMRIHDFYSIMNKRRIDVCTFRTTIVL